MTEEQAGVAAVLIEEGLLTYDQLYSAADAAETAGMTLSKYVVHESLVDEKVLVKVISKHMGFEFVDLGDVTVDPAAASLLPEPLARKHQAVPYAFDGDKLLVATANPYNILAKDDIQAATGRTIDLRVALKSDIDIAMKRLGSLEDAVSDFVGGFDDGVDVEDLAAVEAASEDAPIVKFVNQVILKAVTDGASDIHIEPGDHDVRVRYRIDGVLHEVMRTNRRLLAGVVSRLKIMADIDIAERRRPQDGRISVKISHRSIDLRVSTLPTIYGEKVVMRILDNSTAMLNLSDLGFHPDNKARYESAFTKPYGTILVCGPTGSGKSTTLYATLNVLNDSERNIVTVEDPVEYRLAGVNQVQVNKKAGLTFANALRSFLRQDPDVMLVGEIRDLETANIAIESALTGHLVLSTLHTNTAPAAVSRLTEMGVEPFLVGSAVDAVLAQRLARRLCTKCKEQMEPTDDALARVGWVPEIVDPHGTATIFRSVGCGACAGTGFRGRLAIHELMMVTEEIERLVVGVATTEKLTSTAVEQGMVPIRQDGLRKVAAGETSLEEILRVTV
jgi:type IV pilus assembly protein PilB